MNKMQEFYTKFNLNKYDFAYIAGVGTETLVKYRNGQEIRKDSKERIEKAMRIAEKYNLVRPKFDHVKDFRSFGLDYKYRFHKQLREYEDRFKHLIETEG